MLCPEVSDFKSPKVYVIQKQNVAKEAVEQLIEMNNFYKSVVVTCPDEYNTTFIQNVLLDDTDYYRISNCSVTEFVNENFIEYFVMNGKVTCLSANRNCIVENCAAITPDGFLTIHIPYFVYQTLGLEGIKRPHGYYEIKIDLKSLKHFAKTRNALTKLEVFDFYLTWEPKDQWVCPSSIAKYFFDRKIKVSSHSFTIEKITPVVEKIPTLVDTDVDEIVEWMGMLAHKGDISPSEDYISSYSEPDSQSPIHSTRISILIAKGFITPNILTKLSYSLTDYAYSRCLQNYWVAMSIQGCEECLWQFSTNSPRMFQSHNSSCNIFFTDNSCTAYSIGQLKYS